MANLRLFSELAVIFERFSYDSAAIYQEWAYQEMSDRQKARSFCCSEQAIRSTKSRLNKKIDITILRST